MDTFASGFLPFGQFTINPSAVLASNSQRPFALIEVAFEAVDALIASLQCAPPQRWLMLGVAARSSHFRIETLAQNRLGVGQCDVRGAFPASAFIETRGAATIPASLWPDVSSLPHGPWKCSDDAGGYLCNYLFYRALQKLPNWKIGFLHVPPFESIPQVQQLEFLAQLIDAIESGGTMRP